MAIDITELTKFNAAAKERAPKTLRDLVQRLHLLDEGLARIPQAKRTPEIRQGITVFAIELIRDTLQQHDDDELLHSGLVLNQAIDALWLTVAGRRAALFALPGDELHRSKLDRTQSSIEGFAAAILERAFSDELQNQHEWAGRIARRLAPAGLQNLRKNVVKSYSASAVKEWRKACLRGVDDRHIHYDVMLAWMRKEDYSAEAALGLLETLCRAELGSTDTKVAP